MNGILTFCSACTIDLGNNSFSQTLITIPIIMIISIIAKFCQNTCTLNTTKVLVIKTCCQPNTAYLSVDQSDKILSCFDSEIHDYGALTRTFDLIPELLQGNFDKYNLFYAILICYIVILLLYSSHTCGLFHSLALWIYQNSS